MFAHESSNKEPTSAPALTEQPDRHPRSIVSEFLQIAVISMSILSVSLIVASFLMYSQWRESVQREAASLQRLAEVEEELTRAKTQITILSASGTSAIPGLAEQKGMPATIKALLSDPQALSAVQSILLQQPELLDVLTQENAGELLKLGIEMLKAQNAGKP